MDFGKILVFLGIFLVIIGLFIHFIGRLPGDIYIKKDGFTFYFPITTSIVLSIILSVLLYIFSRFFR
ncbi:MULTISPECIES: DUF2905 domain-containing protein [unclassified Nitratiruptor]|uniref:DUF2905 domain-containing protein n=1 Tax=unclassified Nitratiruptor TaxID=2624044 RepID=UPI00191556CD|nr:MULTISPECIES: DUF2905 domain-containing protein [unclassified Nitratiruptor]BCD59969.1 hypothetical protein NitYY0810_C0732 [Nitratiruptor sp. YY08-10]BCD63892.1 Holliday junction DNA helicase RuvB [Nitratiruptor sp. YY08-14]